MLDRYTSALAKMVSVHRIPVLVVLFFIFGIVSFQIKDLTADFTPKDLFSEVEGQDEILSAFHDAFGNTENVVLILLQSDLILKPTTGENSEYSLDALQYLHSMSLYMDQLESVERVESITWTRIPRRGETNSLRGLLRGEVSNPINVEPIVEGTTVEIEEAELLAQSVSNSNLIRGKLISESGRVAVIAVYLDRTLDRIDGLRDAMNDIRAFNPRSSPPESLSVHYAGLPYVRTVVVDRFRGDQLYMVPLSLVACLFILLITVRWLPGVYLPGIAVVMSALMTLGGMAMVGEKINIVNNIVPVLIIIIGISNGIHLVNRYREELRVDGERLKATIRTVKTMAIACFLTSFTTAVGFASLMVSKTDLLSRFGQTAAAGVMVSYFVIILFLPVMFTFLKPPKVRLPGKGGKTLESIVALLTRWVLAKPKSVLLFSSVIFFSAIFISFTYVEINNSVLDQFSPEDELVHTTRLIEDELQGVTPLELSMSSDEIGRFERLDVINAIDAFQRWAASQDGVLSVNSYSNYLHEAWYLTTGNPAHRETQFENESLVTGFLGSLQSTSWIQNSTVLNMIRKEPDTVSVLNSHGIELTSDIFPLTLREVTEQNNIDLNLFSESLINVISNPVSPYLTIDRNRARISIMVQDIGAKELLYLSERLIEQAGVYFGDLDNITFDLTGEAYINAKGLDAVIRDLLGSLFLAVLIIFGLLTLLFKSPRLGLLSIPPNLIPLVLTLAYMGLRDIRLNTATAMIFSISIGMAVDATIHIFVRFREESRREKSLDEALISASRGAGRAIVITCFMLMAGFSVMLLSSFVPVKRFGELTAITALGCLMGNLVVLPALLKLWWKKPIGPLEEPVNT
jgi:hypothetical protein